MFHIRDGLVNNGKVETEALDPQEQGGNLAVGVHPQGEAPHEVGLGLEELGLTAPVAVELEDQGSEIEEKGLPDALLAPEPAAHPAPLARLRLLALGHVLLSVQGGPL